MVIPCLCSFTVPSSPSAEPPVNKKRTRTLSRKESGSSTNCMVDGTGLEPVTPARQADALPAELTVHILLRRDDSDIIP